MSNEKQTNVPTVEETNRRLSEPVRPEGYVAPRTPAVETDEDSADEAKERRLEGLRKANEARKAKKAAAKAKAPASKPVSDSGDTTVTPQKPVVNSNADETALK